MNDQLHDIAVGVGYCTLLLVGVLLILGILLLVAKAVLEAMRHLKEIRYGLIGYYHYLNMPKEVRYHIAELVRDEAERLIYSDRLNKKLEAFLKRLSDDEDTQSGSGD